MRLAFLGTPEPAVASLRALVEAGHDVRMVITRPDTRRGRGGARSASPVKRAAIELGLRVGHDGLDVERGVVVAYGALIPSALLERIPMLNVHFSLLPRWRGAAPVERAILAGDEQTGVAIMSLEAGLDTGPVHLERRVDVGTKTAAQLTDELAVLGAAGLVAVLASPELLEHPRAQVGEVTYAKKLTTETFHVTPDMPLDLIERTVRLGRAFTFVAARRLGIVAAHRGPVTPLPAGTVGTDGGAVVLSAADGSLVLERVRPEGGIDMSSTAWWAGARLEPHAAWT